MQLLFDSWLICQGAPVIASWPRGSASTKPPLVNDLDRDLKTLAKRAGGVSADERRLLYSESHMRLLFNESLMRLMFNESHMRLMCHDNRIAV